jgi:general secretion pathway protein E
MKMMNGRKTSSLVDMLLQASLLTESEVQRVREIQRRENREELDVIMGEQLVDEEQLALVLSLQLGVPFVNLQKQQAEESAIELLPEWVCRKYGIVPFRITDDGLQVAMEDPRDILAIDDLAALSKRRIEPSFSYRQDIQEAIDRNYRIGGEIATQLLAVPTGQERAADAASNQESAEAIAEAPVVRAVDLLIRQAARDRASDIHIEPLENELRVRLRIDGVLHEGISLPISVHSALISRVKIIAGMNIAESRRPQDGQISIRDGDKELDIRVATSPTVQGEMAVLRILDKTFAFRALNEAGFLPEALESYLNLLKLPYGMILVSGPTGSGKTTTLYGSVNQLDDSTRNIVTIEDPVEYRFSGINQMQVNEQAGMTFAMGLRATMRLDPDTILVGEIRDRETAQVAVQAALTGHLVLSSVHANDTAGVIFRLMDLGIEPFLMASALAGVVAQRMVRRNCPNCTTSVSIPSDERISYEEEMGETREQFLVGAGCTYCARTGYLGRTGIFEVMVVTEKIRRLILAGASADDIRAGHTEEGVLTLWQDGMTKVKMGLTTPGEVIRNVFTMG